MYYVKTKNGIREATDAKEAAAIFLYESQTNNDPDWVDFPGNHEVRDFYSLNDRKHNFFVDSNTRKAVLFDKEEDANQFADLLNKALGTNYCAYMGGVNSDGFIAGNDYIEDWDAEFYPCLYEEWYDPSEFEDVGSDDLPF